MTQNNSIQVFKGAWEELENAILTDNETTISSSPKSFFIKPNGTEIYVISGNTIETYPLSTPWDVDTLGVLGNTFTVTEDATPTGLFFKDDGTKMFVVGQVTKTIYEYTLPTPFDVSSIVASPVSLSLSGVPNTVIQCAFSRDGDFLYVTSLSVVANFSLSIPWDITSNGLPDLLSLGLDNLTDSVTFKREGDKMYIGNTTTRIVTEFILSPINDIMGATPTGNTFLLPTPLEPVDIFFKPTGMEFFSLDTSTNNITKFHLDTDWNIQTASHFENSLAITSNDIRGVTWRPDGLKMYTCERDTDVIREFDVSDPWNMSKAVAGATFDIFLIDDNVADLWWKPDGTRLYICGLGNPVFLTQLNASTPFDVSTLSDSGISINFGSMLSMTGIFFRDDGKKFYFSTASGAVREYDLTDWDLTTLVFVGGTNFSPSIGNIQSLFFKYDGTQLYIIEISTQKARRVTLSTPWRIQSHSTTFVEEFDLSSQFSQFPFGLFVRYDGERMYVVGQPGLAFSYDLSLKSDLLTMEFQDPLLGSMEFEDPLLGIMEYQTI